VLNPLVSIVMPCFNCEKHLRNALISIQNQTYKDFELIAINDGSLDSTEAILMQFDPTRLVYIKNEKNEGVAISLNKGMAAAKGEYIARFDADDFMQPNRIERQSHFLLEYDLVDIVGSGADVFGDVHDVYRPPSEQLGLINEMTLNNPIIHPTIMFRRELIDKGLFKYRSDLATEEDYEIWCRLLPRLQVCNIQESLIRYRIHGSNNQRIPGKFEAKKIALTEFFEHFDVSDLPLVDALAGFQCSGYFSYEGYSVLHEYAKQADRKKLPRLGWLQTWIAKERRYSLFMDYYMSKMWEKSGAI
jgi:glycosyltransferase involved in cell wall biosynthesis